MKSLMLGALILLLAAGCAGTNGHLSKYALTDPAEGISIPHPVEMEKAGVKAFTIFTAIMSPDLWTEAVAAGGVFPILGYLDDAADLFKGYCYLANISWWGDFLLQCVFAYSKSELENAKFAVFNRDAGWAYRLDGQEEDYDSKKFESDENYRKDFFELAGLTFGQLDELAMVYLQEKGVKPGRNSAGVEEIVVGSEKWQAYKAELAVRMPNNYKLANGQIRAGTLPLEDFQNLAVEDPGFTGSQRFVKDLKLPLLALPLTGIAWPVMIGANLASSAVMAGVDDSWSGYFGRAKIIRHDMAPAFRQIVAIYKELLKRRDLVIRQMEKELNRGEKR
ncbi:MAG: hypothetical protein Q7R92_03295 [bacterium]|nr:hypothetical protein [bacterium]